ncbi:hypothetical protein ACFU6R_07510 [Streptomyces sp. NPDC057499]|uniref:hypothetical protein n=1 Tax=Streptomyces sp. NPDC057499 TaxID=3346150 RepID=UPI00368F5EF9
MAGELVAGALPVPGGIVSGLPQHAGEPVRREGPRHATTFVLARPALGGPAGPGGGGGRVPGQRDRR